MCPGPRSPRQGQGQTQQPREQVAGVVRRVSALDVIFDALASMFRHLKMVMLALSPAAQEETASDRAGRLAELQVASTYGGVSGVEVYQSLRIPNTGNSGRREIDLVLLSKRECFLLEVKNWSGTITIEEDGSWLQTRRDGSWQKHPNVVEDTRRKVALLLSYIAKRGLILPPDFIQAKVVLVNPNSRPEQAIIMQPEVLVAENWVQLLQAESAGGVLGWLKSLFPSNQSAGFSESTVKQLHLILSTAPTWDKLDLEGGRILVGDFKRFRGRPDEVGVLKVAKRATVSSLAMGHTRGFFPNVLGILVGYRPSVRVTGTSRDYSGEATALLGRKVKRREAFEVTVSPDLEIVFHAAGRSNLEYIKINSVKTLSLST